ncbi:MAG: hypothetical protein ACJAYN_001565 [Bermanella sp.]|jgi:hypothetical protein
MPWIMENSLKLNELRSQLGFVKYYLAMVFVLACLFYAGHEFADKKNYLLSAKIDVMQSSIDNLSSENQALNSELNVKKVELEVASIANEQAQLSYKEFMRKDAELREQISFYQKVMAPELTQDGFVVESVEIVSTVSANNYAISVMMLQRENIKAIIKGTLNLTLQGSQNTVPINYDLKELLDDKTEKMAFSFKYFQVLELRVTLPEDFIPEQIQIKTDIYKYKRKRGSYASTIEWDEAFSESD